MRSWWVGTQISIIPKQKFFPVVLLSSFIHSLIHLFLHPHVPSCSVLGKMEEENEIRTPALVLRYSHLLGATVR